MELRPELAEYAQAIERTLRRHDKEKGDSWKECSHQWLNGKLVEEVVEYLRAEGLSDAEIVEKVVEHLIQSVRHKSSSSEAVDVGAVGMMLFQRNR